MRKIGYIKNHSDCHTFQFYLYNKGMTVEYNESNKGQYSIWIHSEDQVQESKRILDEFNSDPKNSQYIEESKKGEEKYLADSASEKKKICKIF